MTTIAYHHESQTVAIDTQTTRGEYIKSLNADKTIVRDGVLFLLTGSTADFENLAGAYFGEAPHKPLECSAIVVHDKSAALLQWEDELYIEKLTENAAFGSGHCWALAAMDFGKSAAESVEYAMSRDIYTGGDVREFSVNDF